MDLGLEGKVALVTAASRGLGLACAQTLAGEGVRVGMGARTVASLGVAGAGLPPERVLPLRLDLADHASIDACVSAVVERWGRLDILVANAPGPPSGPVSEITVGQWRDALEMNVVSMVHLVRCALPYLRRDGGRVFFVTTVGVRTVQPDMVLSNATRLAVVGLAKTLALEVAGDGVLVNVLAPGPIATDRMHELIGQTAQRRGSSVEEAEAVWLDEVPLGRMGKPEDLAALVALLSSDRCSYTTGAVITVDGGKDRSY